MLIARSDKELHLLPRMANRHGLIAGATGTGKTVTLQTMAENFSRNGVPVFLSDVKGDLSGLGAAGEEKPKILERVKALGMADFAFQSSPVAFWDVLGKQGHPVRATVSDMGPLLIGRLLSLNEVQTGILTIIFKIADDNGFLLLDLKDLKALVQHVGDNASQYTTTYGNISKASVGAIQRGLLELSGQGADGFFGEPMLDIFDLLKTDSQGRGTVNIFSAGQLMNQPKLYACFLLWMLAELFEQLPEVGDMDKPRLVFFFDEAHLLFEDVPDALLEKVEQVVRLIRSKGVGVYFATQNPKDIPDKVLAQLGNRVQHALRAFTPLEQKAVKIMAQTFRPNPNINITQVITELGVGEALVSFLDEQGSPAMVERALVCPPRSRIGTISPEERTRLISQSGVYGKYERTVDRESAYEVLKKRTDQRSSYQEEVGRLTSSRPAPAPSARRGRPRDTLVETMAKSTVRTIGSQLGRRIVRGVLGSIFGGRSR